MHPQPKLTRPSTDTKATKSSAVPASSVLNIGYTPARLAERSKLLQQAGYETHSAANRESALALLSQRAFSALVIGHAVPELERLEFMSAARKLNPDAIVVLLYWDSIRNAEAADAILCIGNGPTSLVQALRELLGQ